MTENIIILECFFQINVTMQVMQQYSLSMLENDISVRGEIRSLNATESVKEICKEMVDMRYLAIVTRKHFFQGWLASYNFACNWSQHVHLQMPLSVRAV